MCLDREPSCKHRSLAAILAQSGRYFLLTIRLLKQINRANNSLPTPFIDRHVESNYSLASEMVFITRGNANMRYLFSAFDLHSSKVIRLVRQRYTVAKLLRCKFHFCIFSAAHFSVA